MPRLIVQGGHIEIDMSALEKIGSLRRSVRYPLASVTGISRVEVARSWITGFRAPGTHIPRGIALGTWRQKGSTSFVSVRGNGPGYVIDLTGEDRDRLIIESPTIEGLSPLSCLPPVQR